MNLDSSEPLFRPLALPDIPYVLAILEESPEAANWNEKSLKQVAAGGSPVWVAEEAGNVCGFLIGRVVADEFEILNVAVARRSRRKGIGSKLVGLALEFARRLGSPRVYLEVRASNRSAIALYARQGFTPCGRRSQYYREPVEDALLFFTSAVASNPENQ
jgi:[ribosomal protein S18]-alanine N-acetyltransferase